MPSNLNIKYGQKAGTGNAAPINNTEITPGNIYAARNALDQVEIYLDTPQKEGETSIRSRLDPRIYVGSVNDLIGDTTELTQEVINQRKAAATDNIWSNYDVWIDTSGDPTGVATTTTNGLMSSTNVTDINTLKNDMATVKTKIDGLIGALQGLNIKITKNTNDIGGTNTLTILMPSTWSGSTITFNPDGNVTQFTTGGNGS